jgi:lipopolysaccharide exporter
MEFGKYIGKGLWGLAGRALPSVYGVGIILFVIRVFPPVEFGVYTLLQTILLLAIGTAQTFALQPLVKFGADAENASVPVTASAALYAMFILPASLLLLLFGNTLGALFRSDTAGALMWYVALMLVVSFPRNLASFLLQSKLDLRTLFFLDAIYSLGSLALIAWLVSAGTLTTAEGVMQVNLLMFAASSLFGVYLLLKTHAIRPSWSREMLSRMWEYGRYSLGASISYTLYSQSDNLIISAMLGPVSLAVYNAAKVFARIYDLILQTITTLLVPVVSRAHGRNDAGALRVLAEKSLFFFTLPAAGVSALLILFGGPVMSIVYGGKYADAAPILTILACAGVFIPAIAVGASFCHGVAKMKPVFYLNLLTAAAGIGLIALLTWAFGIRGAAYAVLATFALVSPLWVGVLVREVGIPLRVRNVAGRYADLTEFIKQRFRRV